MDDYGEEFSHLPVCPAFKQIGDLRGILIIGYTSLRVIMSNFFYKSQGHSILGLFQLAHIILEGLLPDLPYLTTRAGEWKGLTDENVCVTDWAS